MAASFDFQRAVVFKPKIEYRAMKDVAAFGEGVPLIEPLAGTQPEADIELPGPQALVIVAGRKLQTEQGRRAGRYLLSCGMT